MNGIGLEWLELLEMAENGWKWLEMFGMAIMKTTLDTTLNYIKLHYTEETLSG